MKKRNPIADKQYDKNGQLVKDVEDIGVIDTFAKDNLKKDTIRRFNSDDGILKIKIFSRKIRFI